MEILQRGDRVRIQAPGSCRVQYGSVIAGQLLDRVAVLLDSEEESRIMGTSYLTRVDVGYRAEGQHNPCFHFDHEAHQMHRVEVSFVADSTSRYRIRQCYFCPYIEWRWVW